MARIDMEIDLNDLAKEMTHQLHGHVITDFVLELAHGMDVRWTHELIRRLMDRLEGNE